VWHAAPIRALRRCRLLSSAALLAALGNLTGAAAYCVVAWELALGMGDIHACWPIHCAIKLLVRAKTAHSCGSQQCNRRLHAVDGLIDRCESQRIAHDASPQPFACCSACAQSYQHGNAEQSVRLSCNGRAHRSAWHGMRAKPNRSSCLGIIAACSVL
jgi:hypothetical protein